MKLDAMGDAVISRLLADVIVTTVTMAVEHGQITHLGYMLMSWDRTITSGLQLSSLLEAQPCIKYALAVLRSQTSIPS